MINPLKLALLAFPVVALSACDTAVSPTYQTSPENTIALQQFAAAGERVSIAAVTAAPDVETNPTCRLMGPIDVGGGLTTEQAIRSAFQSELLASGMYAPDGTPLSLTLTDLKVDSFNGYWLISGTVSSPKMPGGFPVQSQFNYSTSFSAYAACNNSAVAFNRATAKFINDIVTNPNFRQAV